MARPRDNITVGGHQMPAGGGTEDLDVEWDEQFLLFTAAPTETIFATKNHTGVGFMQIHTKPEKAAVNHPLVVNHILTHDLHVL